MRAAACVWRKKCPPQVLAAATWRVPQAARAPGPLPEPLQAEQTCAGTTTFVTT